MDNITQRNFNVFFTTCQIVHLILLGVKKPGIPRNNPYMQETNLVKILWSDQWPTVNPFQDHVSHFGALWRCGAASGKQVPQALVGLYHFWILFPFATVVYLIIFFKTPSQPLLYVPFLKVLAKNWRFAPNFDSSCGGQARFARRIVRFAHNMAARILVKILSKNI